MIWEKICDREADVRQMVRLKTENAELRKHAESCGQCRHTLEVAEWMQQFAARPLDSPPVSDPAYLWWKAELLRRWDLQRRAVAPIEIGEQIQAVIGVVLAVILIISFWYDSSDSSSPLFTATLLLPLILVAAFIGIRLIRVIRGY